MDPRMSYAVPANPQMAPYQPVLAVGTPNIIFQQPQNPKQKSCGLIASGIIQIILSAGSIGLSSYVISITSFTPYGTSELCCGIFFFLMGVFSIYGGNHVWRRQCIIATIATLGALGIIASAVAIITNVLEIPRYEDQCVSNLCKVDFGTFGVSARCNGMCFVAYLPIHLALIALAALQGLLGLIMSCAACCNTCSCCCCYKAPVTGQVLMAPPTNVHLSQLPFSGEIAYHRLEA